MIPSINSPAKPNRLIITIAVMSATLMQVLDTTIVNVALPHMQGSLNATPDRISWTLTSYLVASAIFMPLTGYFSDILGRKKYLLWCICGFTIASILCGMATSLTQMVLFRVLQGICGAALVPLSQAIMADTYPPEEMGKAMAIWGAGVMVGPILGPTLGGYLTDIANWRWTFYVNIPIGIIAFLLAWRFIPETNLKKRSFDWTGFLFIAIAIGALQYFLDQGNQEDWFNSHLIQIAAFFTIFGFVGFFVYSCFYCKNKTVVFDLKIFKDRNFMISGALFLISGVGLSGSMVMLPLLLENLMNYPVLLTGFMMTPRAFSAMFSMMIVGRLCNNIDPRRLIIVGLIVSALGTYFGSFYSLETSRWWLIWPSIIQGLGLGLVFIPLSTLTFATLPNKFRAEAAGLSSLMRTLGSSIGISITLTVFTRHTQVAWNQLVGFINPYNPNVAAYLQQIHLKSNSTKALMLLQGELAKQATMLAMVNVFIFIMASFLVMLPFIFLLKYNKNTNKSK